MGAHAHLAGVCFSASIDLTIPSHQSRSAEVFENQMLGFNAALGILHELV